MTSQEERSLNIPGENRKLDSRKDGKPHAVYITYITVPVLVLCLQWKKLLIRLKLAME